MGLARLCWREESRSAAVECGGLGKENPAVIVRGIIDGLHARGRVTAVASSG